MRVALTGASGRVGRVVLAHLLAQGHQVIGIDQNPPAKRRARFIRTDTRDLGQVYGALAGAEAVIHLAAIPSPGGNPNEVVFTTNVLSTYNILEAAAGLGIQRVVVASSVSALGTAYVHLYPGRSIQLDYFPLDEAHPLRSVDTYGLSKQIDEMCCESFSARTGMTTFGLRYSWVTLPSDYRSVIERADDPDLAPGALWSYTDVRDVAQAAAKCLTAPVTGFHPLYITAADSLSNLPTSTMVKRYYPQAALHANLDNTLCAFTNAQAEKLIGYQPSVSWREYAGANPQRSFDEDLEAGE